ncbi:alpha/beta hydrolase [Bifidobacterium sp.]|jgi:acetyl esterase/lipase|uniref:alpha/beta hydrolase n=1 Tax=Bifidobacterium sp. TaxID=41200 RepID=UPI0025BB5DD4|nr:alpha/beta hydrolase [Bifidobacterium sp.]MCH4209873.1 alpha/beta hydrolase [Bifidobacterium sp.]MCI1224490.1 alpha/beta hydrolase [Bifidobacterium sp.]
MQYIQQPITGLDGSKAQFVGYVIDNSPEIDMQRARPAVLILPGGGYEMTSDREAEPIALKVVGAGYQAFILRYSVWPSVYPTALLQAAEAMTIIRTHADEWHVNPEAITVAGFSAGGHLAGTLATTAGNDDLRRHGYDPDAVRPNGLTLAYAVIDSGRFAHRGSFDHLLGERKNDPELLSQLSIDKHVDAKTPPTFLWHTITDETVPIENALLMIAACRKANVSIEAHLYPSGGHGLALGTPGSSWRGVGCIEPCVQTWPRLFTDWIGRTFGA